MAKAVHTALPVQRRNGGRWLADERAIWWVIALLIGVATVILIWLTDHTPVISDAIGYLQAGQQIARGLGPTYTAPNAALTGPYFSLYAFQVQRGEALPMFLGFPPGLPLLMAAAALLTHQQAAVHFVVPLLASVVLLATAWLAWLVSNRPWVALLGVAILLLAPTFWLFGTAPWSEIPSAALLTLGVGAYLLAVRPGQTRARALFLGMAAGLFLGYSIFVRYSNAAILPVIILFDLLEARSQRRPICQPFWVVAGLSVMLIPIFNHFYYGGWNLTSYSPQHGWYPFSPFAWQYALGPSFVDGYSLAAIARTLWANFGVLLLLAPIGWFLLPQRFGWLLGGAALALLAIYAVYAFAPAGVNARFLIPCFPFLAIGGAYTVVWTAMKLPLTRERATVVGIIAVMVWLGLELPPIVGELQARNRQDEAAVASVRAAVAASSPAAVFISYQWNDLIAYYGNRSVLNYRRIPAADPVRHRYQFEMLEPVLTTTIDHLLKSGTPLYVMENADTDFADAFPLLQRRYFLRAEAQSDSTLYRIEAAQ